MATTLPPALVSPMHKDDAASDAEASTAAETARLINANTNRDKSATALEHELAAAPTAEAACSGTTIAWTDRNLRQKTQNLPLQPRSPIERTACDDALLRRSNTTKDSNSSTTTTTTCPPPQQPRMAGQLHSHQNSLDAVQHLD